MSRVHLAITLLAVVLAPGYAAAAAPELNLSRHSASTLPAELSAADWRSIRGQIEQQHGYLKASNTGIEDQFGWSVAISGDTVVVGALLDRV